jgi:hypothetical protein
MCILNALSRLVVILYPKSYLVFLISNVVFAFSTCFIETLAEGASAIITKTEERIKYIKKAEKMLNNEEDDDDEDTSMKAFGFFNNMRAITGVVMTFLGGLASTRVDIRINYAILLFYPVFLFFAVLFKFKEERVN